MAKKSKMDAHLLVEGKNDFHVIGDWRLEMASFQTQKRSVYTHEKKAFVAIRGSGFVRNRFGIRVFASKLHTNASLLFD